MTIKLTDELALRIGVAVRCLPGVDISQGLAILVDALGLPITRAKLDSLTLQRLRQAGQGVLSGISGIYLERALSYLNGSTAIRVLDTPLPIIESYRDGDMDNSLRVAVASNDGERLDGDFMTARRFLIYQVSADALRLVAIRENPDGGGRNGGKQLRLSHVADCRLVYAKSIGTPIRSVLVGIGVHPLCVPLSIAARETLAELQQILEKQPPPWLAKAVGINGRIEPHEPARVASVCS
ncbi:dinitrogenase iron-molybdenum cofactor N-terminal domain-containing protein [Candidatus Methylobacter oryzae]|uniref:Dinitrogenase iron-molybdenum cofactor biosynthesis protein n=1 Tax=Candidatus Methylobacter oryzae TaxID=2497749 RepID=A0ABY3C4G9_9GAMM|nr:dinitrogenase iron-molybdenum cofactor N-terminal domain-containing protein [Candidatus Methylobacter oryzae]TRW89606.1 dinitrogenase iron-molybdenum cofactor biosynthesis protein [Candidatus Methylobacter oryzae]